MALLIRNETPADWHTAELVTKRAFWNLHQPGCSEHYLVHKLRDNPAYVPDLTRVAELDGRLVGAIYYARAAVLSGSEKTQVLTFGPLCVDPDVQRQGIGGALLDKTVSLARELGFLGILIFGEPDYYPRHGFQTCDHFGITTAEGENMPPFMGLELSPGSLSGVHGRFQEPEVYYDLPPEAVEAFDKQFPPMEKKKLPGQWV